MESSAANRTLSTTAEERVLKAVIVLLLVVQWLSVVEGAISGDESV